MPDVRLVDLEVIRRYSLAVRQESADAKELLEVLQADVARLQRAPARRTTRTRKTTSTRSAARRK